MNAHISKDPLHGVTLEMQVNAPLNVMVGLNWRNALISTALKMNRALNPV